MRRCARVVRCCLVSALLSAGAAACAHSPTSPPPPVGFPTLTCPVSLKVPAAGFITHVSYSGPVATGGTPPETVSCSAASNSVFPVGTTTVTCATTDGSGRLAACSFSVTVLPPPVLLGTTFLVFGDSLAAGENGLPGVDIPFPCSPSPGRVGLAFIDCPNAFATRLASLLTARYVVQTPVVVTRGVRGETALGQNLGGVDPGGTDRIGSVLSQTQPDALLLLEGINDLASGDETFQEVISALGFDLDQARMENGKIKLFLSTLTPVRVGTRISAAFVSSNAVPRLNDLIRTLASQKGAVLVDNYTALAGDTAAYIESDGLHPTPLGSQQLAQAWFAAIEANFEQPPAPAALQRHR